MLHKIVAFSVKNKLIIGLFTLAMAIGGAYSMYKIPINSMPDITSNQVSVITQSPTLSAEEVEKLVTYPIELSLSNLPGVKEIRSVSRFGLSNITVVFKEDMGIYNPRQVIAHKLQQVQGKLPEDAKKPTLAPISTGLGEIYQYVLTPKKGYDTAYTARELRSIQDWIVKRRMALTEGVAAVNSFGGDLKEYVVAINPDRLNSMDVSITEIFRSLEQNNQNSGSAYIQKNNNAYYIRAEGLLQGGNLEEIRNIVVKNINGSPITIGDVAKVRVGTAQKYGAMTVNGIGEQVGGIVMMLRGANSNEVITNVKDRMESIRKILPEGVKVKPFLDRSELIGKAIGTVQKNLIEGGLIVIFILVIILGSWRSGIIVGSVVPLSLLFAFIIMQLTGVRASLLSLGAIDFGIIVDGAVILTEFMVFQFTQNSPALQGLTGKALQDKKDEIAIESNSRLLKSVIFSMLIIFIVFIPILTLSGVEGRMFRPMALTFMYALLGALLLCIFYVPMMGALLMTSGEEGKKGRFNILKVGDKLLNFLYKLYLPLQRLTLRWKGVTLLLVGILLGGTYYTFSNMGANFMPTLREGNLVVDVNMDPATSLKRTKKTSTRIEKVLLKQFPEIEMVVSRIGASEIPTDPHGIAKFHSYVNLKDYENWTSADNLEELQSKIKEALDKIPGAMIQINQPIQLRFNEMLTGIYQDIGVKLYGSNLDTLWKKANEAAGIIRNTRGAADVKVEQIAGLPQLNVDYKRAQLAQYGLNVAPINDVIRSFQAGRKVGVVYEGERRYNLDVKFQEKHAQGISDLRNTLIETPDGQKIPLKEVASIQYSTGPAQISRDNTYRRIVVGLNARNRDVESLVNEIKDKLNAKIELPSGYYFEYAGDFEALKQAKQRLAVVVPIALLSVFILLFFSLRSFKHAAMIFTVIPLAAVGGVWILFFRGMDFSITAGIGFIVLFGIAVLDGSVLMNVFNDLKYREGIQDIHERVKKGTERRFRQVILVSAVAIGGFLPMATAVSTGASLQRPLSTVVIGGLISTALLTLIVLPIIYSLFEEGHWKRIFKGKAPLIAALLLGSSLLSHTPALAQKKNQAKPISLKQAIETAYQKHPRVQASELSIKRQQALQKTAINIGKTEPFFNRQTGPVGGSEGSGAPTVTTWGIEHEGIAFPTVYSSRSSMLNEKLQRSRQNLAVTKNRIKRDVTKAYYRVAYGKSRLAFFKYLDSVYRNFLKAAEVRYETGAISKVEKVSAEGKYREIQVRLKKARQDLQRFRKTLKTELGLEKGITITLDSIQQFRMPMQPDTSQLRKNPLLDFYRQSIQVQQSQEAVEQNKLLPSFSLEAGRMNFGNTSGATYRIGVGIPLWSRPQQGRIQSAQIEVKRSRTQYRNAKLQLRQDFQQARQNYQKHLSEVQYYREKGLDVARQLLRNANKSFKAGAIDYVAYVQFVDQAINIRLKYLRALHNLNQSSIRLTYLMGQ